MAEDFESALDVIDSFHGDDPDDMSPQELEDRLCDDLRDELSILIWEEQWAAL